jgi:hypothetical protein
VVLLRKVLQGIPDLLGQELALPAPCRISGIRLRTACIRKPLQSSIFCRLAAPLPVRDPPCTVSSNGIEPPCKFCRLIEVWECLKGDDENILSDVFGGRVAFDHLPRNKLYGPPIPLRQSVKGREIAQKCRNNEGSILCR